MLCKGLGISVEVNAQNNVGAQTLPIFPCRPVSSNPDIPNSPGELV